MKKLLLIMTLSFCGLFGCSKKETDKKISSERPNNGLTYQMANIASGGASLLWETKESYYIIYADKGIGSMDGDDSQIEKKFSDIGKKTTGGKKTGGYLYATGKDTLDWKEVCTNSHCSHTGFYCEARLAGGQVSVGIYDEHLYFTSFDYAGENEMGLYRMKMDGSDRELIDSPMKRDGPQEAYIMINTICTICISEIWKTIRRMNESMCIL